MTTIEIDKFLGKFLLLGKVQGINTTTILEHGKGGCHFYSRWRVLFEMKQNLVLFHLSNDFDITVQHFLVGVHEDHTANIGDQIDRRNDTCTGLHVRFDKDKGRQILHDFETGRRLDGTRRIRYQVDQLSLGQKGTGVTIGQFVEFFFFQIGIDGPFDLTVSGNGLAQGLPRTVTTVGPTIHFHQTGCTVLGNDDFSVTGPVLDAQYIQDGSHVGNEDIGLFRLRIDGDFSKIHKGRPVGLALIVQPHHDRLVHPIARHVIDNVFVAL
eukprot:scaffold450_cov175-Amphora_coffeaeformis.AAC.4